MVRRLLLTTLAVTLCIMPAASRSLEAPPAGVLPARFAGAEYILLPRDATLEDALDGEFVLKGESKGTYRILVREAELFSGSAAPLVSHEGAAPMPDPTYAEFPTRFFLGHVEGEPDSRAGLTITRVGVSGFIQMADDLLVWEPLVFHDAKAAIGATVLYKPSERPVPFTLVDQVVEVSTPADGDRSPLFAPASVTNRPVKLVVDSEFYSAFYPCWYCKTDSVFAYAVSTFGAEFTWDVSIWGRVGCATTSCDSSWGITSTAPSSLLANFGSYQQAIRNLNSETWELAQLMSGKNFDGSAIGMAYAGGRYTIGQFVNEGTTYTPNDDYEAGIVSTHELAHNFEATHHDTTTTHCHVATTPCPTTSTYTHALIMNSAERNNPTLRQEQMFDIDSTNVAVMDACNTYNFNSMTYSPQAHTC